MSVTLNGQVDTSIQLSKIQITSSVLQKLESDTLRENTKEVTAAQQIGKVLSNNGIHIRNYGPGSLATITLLGGSSNQTLIKWNDVPIVNPMLGLADLSLINLRHFDNADINYGGQSSSEGQGAITGSISLKNRYIKNNSAEIELGQGSLGLISLFARGQMKINKFSFKSTFEKTFFRNDFTYPNPFTGDEVLQSHGAYNNLLSTHLLEYQIADASTLSFNLWYQNSDREIPPTTVQNFSRATQQDKVRRGLLTYNYNNSKISFVSKVGWFDETNNFSDPIILLESSNRFKRFVSQSKLLYAFSNAILLDISLDYLHTDAKSESYSEKLNNLEGAVITSYENDHMEYSLGGRTAHNEFNSMPIAPMLSIKRKIGKGSVIGFKLSKEFRFPTLNDFYWNPGGNRDLKPESGWAQELLFKYRKSKKTSIKLIAFHRRIDNWILWALQDNNQFFSATNLSKVKSYGVHTSSNFAWTEHTIKSRLQLSYNYTISKNEVALTNPKINKGDQLFYTPKHNASVSLSLDFPEEISFTASSNCYSSSKGINDDVDGYQVIGLSLTKTHIYGEHQIQGSLVVENLLDKRYRIIERRPMPGRQIYFKLKYTFIQ